MMKGILFVCALIIGITSKAQLAADSIYIYYGMTQQAPEEPLMDYIENLETSGAKTQKIAKDDFNKINVCFNGVKAKKYKGEKHKGTIYFVVVFKEGNKQFGAFDTTTEEGKFINLSEKKIWNISDSGLSDKLYYCLLNIH